MSDTMRIILMLGLMKLLLACQSEPEQSIMNNPERLDTTQSTILQQWLAANDLSASSFHVGSDDHQGSHSILIQNRQVVAIKAKGVLTIEGLASLPALNSLSLSVTAHADLSGCPASLQQLRINGKPSDTFSLALLKDCPDLTELKIYYNHVKDWDSLKHLAKLQSLSIRYSNIENIEFSFSMPALKQLNLTHNQLQSVQFTAPQPHLQSLLLSDNQLHALPYLSSLTALTTLNLNNNPLQIMDMVHLPSSLQKLDIRNTAWLNYEALADLKQLQKVQVQRQPKNLPSELADKFVAAIEEDSQLAIAEDLMQKYLDGVHFIEELPKSVNGKALGLRKESSQRFNMSGRSDLSGDIHIDEIQGLMRIPLAQTDNLLYQQRQVQITGRISVADGIFRIYSPVNMNFWQMAALFVDHPRKQAPANSKLKIKGFIVHEARPGQPVTFLANLIPMADRYLLLVGADRASGVNITYQ